MEKQIEVVAGGAIANDCQLEAVLGAACAEGHDCVPISEKFIGAVHEDAGLDTGMNHEEEQREDKDKPEATVCEKKDDW